MFRDCRAWCWGRHLFQEGKPLEVKHFCSKLLQRSSENMLGWSTAVILGAEHQVHKNSSGRQVASFQHAKYCSSTVSHPSFCILIHSYIYISLYIYMYLQSTIICNLPGKNKRARCIKVFKTWRSLSEFSPRVQFWGPESLCFLFYFILVH